MSAADQPELVARLRANLWQAGFRPVALLTNQKHTHVPEWTQRARRDPPADAVEPPRRDYLNTGILCNGLRVIDIDVDDAEIVGRLMALVLKLLGDGALIRSRSNSVRGALLYRAAQGSPSKRTIVGTHRNEDGSYAKVEVLGTGQQLHAFGRHPSGADLVWYPKPPGQRTVHSLPTITEDDLQTFLAAAAPLIGAPEPIAPTPLVGDATAVPCTDIHDNELTADPFVVANAVKAIPNDGPANWEDWNRVGMAIWAATTGSAAGFAAWDEWSRKNAAYDEVATRDRWEHYFRSPPSRIGAGTLFYQAEKAGWVRPILLNALKRAHASSNSADGSSAASSNAWPDVDQALLESSWVAVPPLPLEVFPPASRSWICATAEGAGAPVDYVAQGLLACVAGVTGAGVLVQPTAGSAEPLVLWLVCVGSPSSGKSPALAAARTLINAVESAAASNDDVRRRNHAAKAEEAKLATEKWRKDLDTAVKAGSPPPDKPISACFDEPFIPTQIVITDATIESVADIISGNPRGVVLWRDELSAFMSNFERYSRGTDRPLWLEAYGAATVVINRKSRSGPLRLKRFPVSIVGAIQPDRLAEMFSDADDGMAARLLYSWPDHPQYTPLQLRRGGFDPEAAARLQRIASAAGTADDPLTLRLDAEAVALLDEFSHENHVKVRTYDGLEAGWFGKGTGYVVRLAGALALLEWSESSDLSPPRRIGVETVRRAARLWADYYLPVAETVIAATGRTPSDKADRRVVRWIRQYRPTLVSREDVRRRALRQALNATETDRVIKRLVEGGVLRPSGAAGSGNLPGRPVRRWEVNPAILVGDKGDASDA